jgi:regulator of replication initiation timing
MDDLQVITQTLNNSLQRHLRTVGNYEVEVANLTADVIRLQGQLETLSDDNLRLSTEIAQLRLNVESPVKETPEAKRTNKES